MAVQVLIPERKSFMDKTMGQFGQFAQGAQGISSIKGLFGGGAAASPTLGAGASSGMGLGVGNVTPVTTGMSPTLGGGAAAPAATGGEAASGMSTVAPYAAPAGALGAAAVDEYQYQSGVRSGKTEQQGTGRYAIGQGSEGQKRLETFNKAGRDINAEANRFVGGLGLTEGKPDKLGAMERRYSNQQTAMQDIQAAQKELVNSGIPEQERVRIGQKLEIARQQMEGRSRGPRNTYS